jgi:hypothetical protein
MRRAAWLIWLCMALVPLRGMAHAGMILAGVATPLPVAAAEAPCPMHAAASAAVTITDDATPSHAASCQLCALCHAAAMPPLTLAEPLAGAPSPAPHTGAGLGAGLDGPDGLFKPPRA